MAMRRLVGPEAEQEERNAIRALNPLGKPISFALEGPPGTSDPSGIGSVPAPPSIGGPGQGGGTGPGGPSGIAPPRDISPERSNLPGLAEETGVGVSALGRIAQQALGLGKKIGDLSGPSTGSFEMSPETRAAYEAQRAGERQDFSSLLPSATAPSDFAGALQALQAETPGVLGALEGPLSGALYGSPEGLSAAAGQTAAGLDLGGEAAGAIGEGVGAGAGAGAVGEGAAAGLPSFDQLTQGLGPALQAGGSVLGTALSAYKAALADNDFDKARGALHAALYAASLAFPPLAIAPAAADLVDTLVQAFGGPTLAQLLGFAPSDEWMAFAPTLSENLSTTGQALEQLGMDVVNAGDESAIQDAIGKYTTTIGGFAGDFGVGEKYGGTGSGIAVPPGATGTEHEGGQTANWEEAVNMLEGLLATKRASFGGGGAAPDEGPMASQMEPKLRVVDDVGLPSPTGPLPQRRGGVGQMAPELRVVDDVGPPPTGPPPTRRAGDVGPRGAARPINPIERGELNPPERTRRPYQPVERAAGGPSQGVLGAGRRRLRIDEDDEDEA